MQLEIPELYTLNPNYSCYADQYTSIFWTTKNRSAAKTNELLSGRLHCQVLSYKLSLKVVFKDSMRKGAGLFSVPPPPPPIFFVELVKIL